MNWILYNLAPWCWSLLFSDSHRLFKVVSHDPSSSLSLHTWLLSLQQHCKVFGLKTAGFVDIEGNPVKNAITLKAVRLALNIWASVSAVGLLSSSARVSSWTVFLLISIPPARLSGELWPTSLDPCMSGLSFRTMSTGDAVAAWWNRPLKSSLSLSFFHSSSRGNLTIKGQIKARYSTHPLLQLYSQRPQTVFHGF